MKINFGWLTGKTETGEEAPNPTRRAFLTGAVALAAAGAAVAVGGTPAQAWHHGHPHGPPGHGGGSYGPGGHSKWRSQEWRERQRYEEDYHSRKRSSYRRQKYYHRKYGSWDAHPQCLHLGPFGVCEY
jgi:hypothetical protein